MRVLLCICLTAAISVTSGCIFGDNGPFGSGSQAGDKMYQETSELSGPKSAKLNSIGCLSYVDMQTLIDQHGDFETTDKLIREKRCFVLPTDTEIYVKERVKGDIVSAKLKGSIQLFYTSKNNLIAN